MINKVYLGLLLMPGLIYSADVAVLSRATENQELTLKYESEDDIVHIYTPKEVAEYQRKKAEDLAQKEEIQKQPKQAQEKLFFITSDGTIIEADTQSESEEDNAEKLSLE